MSDKLNKLIEKYKDSDNDEPVEDYYYILYNYLLDFQINEIVLGLLEDFEIFMNVPVNRFPSDEHLENWKNNAHSILNDLGVTDDMLADYWQMLLDARIA